MRNGGLDTDGLLDDSDTSPGEGLRELVRDSFTIKAKIAFRLD